jgi:DNA processing protein
MELLTLLIDRMSFLKPAEKRLLSSRVDSLESLERLTLDDIARIVGRPVGRSSWYFPLELRAAERGARWLAAQNATVITMGGAYFPRALAEIYDPPFVLYLRGAPDALAHTPIGVVGTRLPSAVCARAAYDFGAQAAGEGHILVSGLARGIDAMVHRGAVSKRGAGVAVLGSGIDTIYPRENRRLAMDLLDNGGALVSEYPPGVPALKYHFPARNRIISGLVQGVVLVQAPTRSGALITVDHALEQGRDVFVHQAGLGTGAESSEGAASDQKPVAGRRRHLPGGGNTESREGPGRFAGGVELAASGAPVVRSFYDVAESLGLPLESRRAGENDSRETSTPRRSRRWGNSLADQMARQLLLGDEEGEW